MLSVCNPDWTSEGAWLCRSMMTASNRVKAMGARLTPRKTVVQERLKLPERFHAPFHIAGDQVQCRQRKTFAFRPTGWEHARPPGEMGSREGQRIEGRLSCQLQTSLEGKLSER